MLEKLADKHQLWISMVTGKISRQTSIMDKHGNRLWL
jgi:hypothetical protein